MQVFRPVLNTDFILEGLEPILKKGWIGLGEKVERLEKENHSLHKQIDRLADYLTKNDLILGSDKEYPAGSGACEMAIRIIKQLREK